MTLRASVALIAALSLAGCCKKPATDSGPFTGNYMSNYGPCSMVQSGSRVDGACPGRGTTFTCAASGSTIHCDWKEGGASGKSVASRQSDGKVIGTYGTGASTTNGGAWNFNPK